MNLVTDRELQMAYAHVRQNMSRRERRTQRRRPMPLEGLRDALNAGRYAPSPLQPGHIRKDDGTWRELLIPTAYDRMAAYVALQRLAPVHRVFPANVVGFLPGVGVQTAVLEVAAHFHNHRTAAIFKADIRHFFPSCDHRVALRELAGLSPDPLAYYILDQQYARWGVEHGGVPQGCPASPLLSNLALLETDRELATLPNVFYRRYADDAILIADDGAALATARFVLEKGLRSRALELHPDKSGIIFLSEFDFLGILVRRDGRLSIPPAAWRSLERMTAKAQRRGWWAHYCFAPRWNAFLRGERDGDIVKSVVVGRSHDIVTVVRSPVGASLGVSRPRGPRVDADQVVAEALPSSGVVLEEKGDAPGNVNGEEPVGVDVKRRQVTLGWPAVGSTTWPPASTRSRSEAL